MKVLHVTPYMHASYGGPSAAVHMMATLAAQAGTSVEIATTTAAGPNELDLPDGATVVEDGVPSHYFRRTFPRGWFRAPAMTSWLMTHVGEIDVLHLHVPFTAPFRMAAKVAQALDKPYIVTPHGLLDPWSMRQKSWKKVPYLHFLERANLRQAALLHATAPLEEESITALNLNVPVVTLPLAVEYSAQPGLPRIRNALPFRVLFLGRLHPVKALPILLQAIAILLSQGHQVILDIAGGGEPEYEAFLRTYVDQLGSGAFVVWHGHVGDEKKRLLYGQASIAVLPSYHENFGLAAAEAMAAGVPVIVSDQVGLAPDIRQFGAGAVVPCGDPAALAMAIKQFFDNDAVIRCSGAARQLVEQRYSTKTCQNALISLYERAVSLKGK
jgi:glycosyltransferase involved in cell wall biosynthesis